MNYGNYIKCTKYTTVSKGSKNEKWQIWGALKTHTNNLNPKTPCDASRIDDVLQYDDSIQFDVSFQFRGWRRRRGARARAPFAAAHHKDMWRYGRRFN